MQEPIKVQYLGRTLGEASGWDGNLGEVWWFYNFKPASGVNISECECLQIDDLVGVIYTQDHVGNNINSFDTIETMRLIRKD